MNTVTEQMLRQFTDEELYRLSADVAKEEERRRREYKSKMIEDFRKAWLALKDAHIYVKYSDSYEDPMYLANWDGFEFGD
jgi:hypothetical protein